MYENIERYPSYYRIPNVTSLPKAIDNSLSKWDGICYKMDRIGYYYDEVNKEVRIPAGYPEDGVRVLFPYRNIIDKDVNVYDEVKIKLVNSPKDYIQTSTFAFMTGSEPFSNMSTKQQLYVDLDTGLGKTYLGIAVACYYKSRLAVITPGISKITDQWMESISKFTSLHRDEFLLVKGSDMCVDIIDGKYSKIKIFVIPRSTILSFVRKYENNWSLVTRLIDAMKVNIRVIDEAHMDFSTMVKIDCFSNVAKTYYMSSSPTRSEMKEKKIYHRVFKTVPRYGKDLLTKEQHHIIPLIIQFKSTPTLEQLKEIKTVRGPSLAKYSAYLLDPEGAREEFLEAYCFAMITLQRYRRRGGKILVLCATIDFAEQLRNYTNEVFPYLSTGLFVGSGKDKNKELMNDVIFSTKQSMGTGSEIENHQLTINTLTYTSDVMTDQLPGRIRKQEERNGIYCEIVNMAHKVAREHYMKREPNIIKKAKDGKILVHEITHGDKEYVERFFHNNYMYSRDGLLMDRDGYIIITRKNS